MDSPVQNLGSSEMSSQSDTPSQYLFRLTHLPFLQGNSEILHAGPGLALWRYPKIIRVIAKHGHILKKQYYLK